MKVVKVERDFQGSNLVLETGRLAKQAGGSVLASWGGTQLLATATMSANKSDRDFFPLSVDYIEKFYANAKIPGSYTRREAKPSNEEIQVARLIDRPLRPLFDNSIRNEIQVIITVLSMDDKNSSDILALIAASAALIVSDIPFSKPVGAARVGYAEEHLVINPSHEQIDFLSLNLVVAGTDKAITMIEGGGNETSEEKVLHAVEKVHEVIKDLVELQLELASKVNKEKREVQLSALSEDLRGEITQKYRGPLEEILSLKEKTNRESEKSSLYEKIKANFSEKDLPVEQIPTILYKLESDIVRKMILEENKRPDGRAMNEIRDLACEINVLEKPHGSALFTRGETQALGIVTIGSDRDKQKLDLTKHTINKNFLLHYNFPPYSVGEVNRLGSIGRREIGHGMLAEKSPKFCFT